MLDLKKKKSGSFPSFEHAVKDPVENAIQVKETDKIVIVDGLYLFLKEWQVLINDRIFSSYPISSIIEYSYMVIGPILNRKSHNDILIVGL